MSTYQLFVKIDKRWKSIGQVEAGTQSEAFRAAMQQLDPKYYDKPIRLDPVVKERSAAKRGTRGKGK